MALEDIMVQYGAMGAMLAWFMLSFTPAMKETNAKLDALTTAINRLADAQNTPRPIVNTAQ